MPPSNPADRQKLLLQQEIAKLSGQISRQASSSRTTHHPYRSSTPTAGGFHSRGRDRGRGRGRGRGGHRSIDLRSERPVSSSPTAHVSNAQPGWIRSTSASGNMSLMTAESKNKLAAQTAHLTKPVLSVATSKGQRVIIDGVEFQFEQDGRKLIRVDDATMPALTSTPTRKSYRYAGHKFRRTSRGNLVHTRKKSSTPCLYYTKTGRCNRALDCPYSHDPHRLAICPKYLRSTCPHSADTCPLSHLPSAHNTPSCVHFQATSSCRNGSTCLYPHVKVAAEAPVCESFARGGWCDEQPGTCPHLHAWECQEYREKGTCSRAGKCGLRHVHRAENDKMDGQDHADSAGSFEENTDYVNFDVGSPPPVEEVETESSDSEVDDTSGSDDSDDAVLGIVS